MSKRLTWDRRLRDNKVGCKYMCNSCHVQYMDCKLQDFALSSWLHTLWLPTDRNLILQQVRLICIQHLSCTLDYKHQTDKV